MNKRLAVHQQLQRIALLMLLVLINVLQLNGERIKLFKSKNAFHWSELSIQIWEILCIFHMYGMRFDYGWMGVNVLHNNGSLLHLIILSISVVIIFITFYNS